MRQGKGARWLTSQVDSGRSRFGTSLSVGLTGMTTFYGFLSSAYGFGSGFEIFLFFCLRFDVYVIYVVGAEFELQTDFG